MAKKTKMTFENYIYILFVCIYYFICLYMYMKGPHKSGHIYVWFMILMNFQDLLKNKRGVPKIAQFTYKKKK